MGEGFSFHRIQQNEYKCCLRGESGSEPSPCVKEHVSNPYLLSLLLCVAALSKTIRGSGTEQRDDGTQCLYRENVSDGVSVCTLF